MLFRSVIQTLETIIDNTLLKSRGLIIIEHENELVLENKFKNLIKYDTRKYKSKSLSFYRIGDKI